MNTRPLGFLAVVVSLTVAANFAVLPVMPFAVRLFGYVAFTFVLPGAALIRFLFRWDGPVHKAEAIVLSAGASAALSVLVLWLLYLLPFKLSLLTLVAAFDLVIVVLSGLALVRPAVAAGLPQRRRSRADMRTWLALLLLALLSIALVTIRLDILDLSGDEFSVVTRALDVLLDKRESLFTLTKGPAQILLVAGAMRLTDSFAEGVLRLPFALSAVIAALAFALLARVRLRLPIAFVIALLMISEGMLLGMARWVQYQMFVMAMSLLALYCAWRARQLRRTALAARYWLLATLFAGVGLLGHYDAGLILPAIAVIFFSAYRTRLSQPSTWRTVLGLCAVGALIAIPFYVLYLSRASGVTAIEDNYVNDRVNLSGAPYSNLNDFLVDLWDFDSAYRVPVIAGLLGLAGFYVVRSRRRVQTRWDALALGVAAIGIVVTVVAPDALTVGRFNLSFVPFLALFALLLLRFVRAPYWLMVLTWTFSVFAFTGFVMQRPFDHYFIGLPALLLIAGYGLASARRALVARWPKPFVRVAVPALCAAWLVVVIAYVSLTEIAYFPDMLLSHPERALPFFPQLGSTHQQYPAYYGVSVGWRAVAMLFANGELRGENDSTVEQSRDWYLSKLWQPPTPQPRYFIAARPQKPGFAKHIQPLDGFDAYELWGTIMVDGDPQIQVFQHKSPGAPGVPRLVTAEDYAADWLAYARLSRIEQLKASQRDDSAFYALSQALRSNGQTGDVIVFDTRDAVALFDQFYTGSLPYLNVSVPQDLSRYRRIWGVWWANNPALSETTMAMQAYPISAQWFGNIRLRQYGVAPALPLRSSGSTVGTLATLTTISALPAGLRPGDLLPLRFEWHANQATDTRYKVFVHVTGADGKPIAQADSEPVADLRPTSGWQAGEVIIDRIGIWLPPNTKAGRYQVVAGFYDPVSGARLTAASAAGAPYPNDAIPIGTIEVASQ